MAVDSAIQTSMNDMLERVGGIGGCIAVDCLGKPTVYFTSEGMSWASITNKRN